MRSCCRMPGPGICHCEQDTFLPRCGVGVQKDAEPERIVPECGKGLRTVDLAGGWWRSGVVGRTRLSLRSGPQSGDRQHVAPSTHPLTTPCDRLRAHIRSLHCSCHLSALKQTAFVFPRCRWTSFWRMNPVNLSIPYPSVSIHIHPSVHPSKYLNPFQLGINLPPASSLDPKRQASLGTLNWLCRQVKFGL